MVVIDTGQLYTMTNVWPWSRPPQTLVRGDFIKLLELTVYPMFNLTKLGRALYYNQPVNILTPLGLLRAIVLLSHSLFFHFLPIVLL